MPAASAASTSLTDRGGNSGPGEPGSLPGPSEPSFAHASEAELARILDYYQVAWQYEPRTFPILFNLDGAVVESFAPDFYLPEFDLYVELTTLKQSLVRKKNRKLRRLRELYPDVRIKLFYARDFKALLLKYGRFDLAASLSGHEGQARPASDGSIDAIETPAGPIGAVSGKTSSATPHAARPSTVEPTGLPLPMGGQHPSAATPPGATEAATAVDDAGKASKRSRSRRNRRRRRAATRTD